MQQQTGITVAVVVGPQAFLQSRVNISDHISHCFWFCFPNVLLVLSLSVLVVHLQQQVYTAVQPLTLLLKCLLKQRSLAEVYMGGLGSWSLANMVIAHLKVGAAGGGQTEGCC